jgi:hypothetical protein
MLIDDRPQRSRAAAVGAGGDGGGSGPGSARPKPKRQRRQSGYVVNGETPLLGASNARWRPHAAERSGSGRETAEAAGQRPQPSDPAGPARGRRLQLSPAKRQRRQSGYVVERRHFPSRGRQCSSATTRIGAERQQQRNGECGGAAAPAQPGGPGPKAKRRRQHLGWQRWDQAETAGAAAPAQPPETKESATAVGVRGQRGDPFLGQAVLVDDHKQRSGAAAAEGRRRRLGKRHQRSPGISPGLRLQLSPAKRQRRQPG